MQNRIFQNSANFMQAKNQKTNLAHLYINLVETVAFLILNSKNLFQEAFMILKKILFINPLMSGGNKRSHMLKAG